MAASWMSSSGCRNAQAATAAAEYALEQGLTRAITFSAPGPYFGYNPEIARNISVDVRYLLWILEEIEGASADALLRELGLAGS